MTVPPSLRRAVRLLGWSLCGLLALLLLVAGGSLLFLRTPLGERIVAEQAVSALRGAGIEASLGALEGPLPFTLRLRDVRLSDADGVWLDVSEATLRVGVLPLLRGHLLVEELALAGEMPRLPKLPPSEPEPATDPLDSLRPAFLRPLGADIAGWLRLATVERLHVGRFQLGQAVMGFPLEASLDGGGPLTDVALEVEATLHRPEAAQEKGRVPLLSLAGLLHFGNAGAWLASSQPDVAAAADLRLTVPAQDAGATPDAHEGRLTLLAELAGGRLSLPSLSVVLPGVQLAGSKLFLEDLKLGGELSVALQKPEALMRTVAAFAGADPVSLPLASAGLDAELSGMLESPALSLKASAGLVPDAAQPEALLDVVSSWTLAARSLFSEPALTVDGSVSLGGPFAGTLLPAGVSGKAELLRVHAEAAVSGGVLAAKGVRIDSRWLELSGEASLHQATGRLAAKVRGKLPSLQNLTAFPPVAAALAGSPLRELGGAAEASAEIRREEGTSPVAGRLHVRLDAMRWGMPPLQNTLGERVELGLELSARPESGAFGFRDLSLKAARISANGDASLAAGKLNAALSIALSSLSGIDPALSGPLEVDIRASGPLAEPEGELMLKSPRLGVNAASLEAFQARVKTPGAGERGGRGTLELSARLKDSKVKSLQTGAPVRIAADWAMTPERFSLKQALLEAPGIALSGSLEALPAQRKLDGGFRLAVTDWAALSSLAGVPLQGASASASLSLASGKTQRLVADWSCGALSGPSFSVRGLKGNLALDDCFGRQGLALSATLGNGRAADFRWKGGKADVSGSLQQPTIQFSLQGKTNANIRAALDLASMKGHVDRLTLTDRRNRTLVGVRLNTPLNVAFGNGLSIDNLDLSILPQGTLTALGSLSGRKLALEARLRDVALNMARLFVDAPVPDGLLNASVALSGTPSRPQGNLDVSLTKLAFPESDMPPAAVEVKGRLQPSGLALSLRTDGMGTSPAAGTFMIPLVFSASGLPEPSLNKPFSGNLSWEGQLASLWRFVPLANSSLTGLGSFDMAVSGTLSAPVLSASLRLEQAAFEEVLLGLALSDINTNVSLHSEGLSRLSFSATDGQGGAIGLNGTIGPLAEGFPLALHGAIRALSPLHRNDVSVTLSGTADITGPAAAPDVRADITVDKGAFQIVGSFGTNIPTLDVVEAGQEEPSAGTASGAGPQLGVTVTIPNRFFVRGKGLESEWKGRIQIDGPASDPVITGGIHSIRGQFGLLGKQFILSRGDIEFSGATPPNPMLNVLVTYAASNITAEATVSGSATSPTLTLSSQPPLPQDEIVSQVLFGQSASSLGRMEALQLAAEVASLSGFGSGGLGILGEVRQSLGFDVLRFGSIKTGQPQQLNRNIGLLQPPGKNAVNAEENSIPSLEVGKYVMDNVYVGLEQGMSGDATGVRVEIELTPNLNLEGISTPEKSQVGLNWKKDY